jgi:hypothetical protein
LQFLRVGIISFWRDRLVIVTTTGQAEQENQCDPTHDQSHQTSAHNSHLAKEIRRNHGERITRYDSGAIF